MKPIITSEFVRGVIFAVVAYETYHAGRAFYYDTISYFSRSVALIFGLFISLVLHWIAFSALLQRKERSGRTAYLLFLFGAAFQWSTFLYFKAPQSMKNAVLMECICSVALAALAFAYDKKKFPEQV